jgi:hypothetical protein
LLCGAGDPAIEEASMLDRSIAAALLGALMLAAAQSAAAQESDRGSLLILVTGPTAPKKSFDQLTPEEKMQRRYPQPVRVGDLIGLPVLDDADRTLGRVQSVVRTADGKIELIVPYGGLLGWGQRPIAVPIEAVGIAGRQLAALDMTRAEFEAAPAWTATGSQPVPAGETIRVALYRR